MSGLALFMTPWQRYFIVDTSVNRAGRLRFGRGFIDFLENGEPNFGYNPDNVKLFEKIEEAMEVFNKITEKVAVIHFSIAPNPNTRQIDVIHNKIASK